LLGSSNGSQLFFGYKVVDHLAFAKVLKMNQFSVYRFRGWNPYAQSEFSHPYEAQSAAEAAAMILSGYANTWIAFLHAYSSDSTFVWGSGQEQLGRIVVVDKGYYVKHVDSDYIPLRSIIERGSLEFHAIMNLSSVWKVLHANWAEFYTKFSYEMVVVDAWRARRLLPPKNKQEEILGFINMRLPEMKHG
jgi:hypothetical protein